MELRSTLSNFQTRSSYLFTLVLASTFCVMAELVKTPPLKTLLKGAICDMNDDIADKFSVGLAWDKTEGQVDVDLDLSCM